jgi:hypothetical protein
MPKHVARIYSKQKVVFRLKSAIPWITLTQTVTNTHVCVTINVLCSHARLYVADSKKTDGSVVL